MYTDQTERECGQEEGQCVQRGYGGAAQDGEQGCSRQGAEELGALDCRTDQAVEVAAKFAGNG